MLWETRKWKWSVVIRNIIEQQDCQKWSWKALKAQFLISKFAQGQLCFFRSFLRSITVIFISSDTWLCKQLCQTNERRQTTCSACRAQVPSKQLLGWVMEYSLVLCCLEIGKAPLAVTMVFWSNLISSLVGTFPRFTSLLFTFSTFKMSFSLNSKVSWG